MSFDVINSVWLLHKWFHSSICKPIPLSVYHFLWLLKQWHNVESRCSWQKPLGLLGNKTHSPLMANKDTMLCMTLRQKALWERNREGPLRRNWREHLSNICWRNICSFCHIVLSLIWTTKPILSNLVDEKRSYQLVVKSIIQSKDWFIFNTLM